MAMNETAAFGICLALSATVHTFALIELGGLGSRQPAIVEGAAVYLVDLISETAGNSYSPEGKIAAGAVLSGQSASMAKVRDGAKGSSKGQDISSVVRLRVAPRTINAAPSASPVLSSAGAQAADGAASGGPAGAALTYGPKPPYPHAARMAGFEGSLSMEILVSTDGSVLSGQVVQSSGRDDCDRSALETVLSRWRFEPATKDRRPAQSRERIVVKYALK